MNDSGSRTSAKQREKGASIELAEPMLLTASNQDLRTRLERRDSQIGAKGLGEVSGNLGLALKGHWVAARVDTRIPGLRYTTLPFLQGGRQIAWRPKGVHPRPGR